MLFIRAREISDFVQLAKLPHPIPSAVVEDKNPKPWIADLRRANDSAFEHFRRLVVSRDKNVHSRRFSRQPPFGVLVCFCRPLFHPRQYEKRDGRGKHRQSFEDGESPTEQRVRSPVERCQRFGEAPNHITPRQYGSRPQEKSAPIPLHRIEQRKDGKAKPNYEGSACEGSNEWGQQKHQSPYRVIKRRNCAIGPAVKMTRPVRPLAQPRSASPARSGTVTVTSKRWRCCALGPTARLV